MPPSLNQPSPAAAAVNAELLAGAAANGGAAGSNGSSSSSNGSNGSNGAAAAAAAEAASTSGSGPPTGAILDAPSMRGLVRPPVEHQWGCSSPPVHGTPHAPVSVFRHRLLQLFQLSIFCKLPVLPVSTLEDLR